MQVDQKAMKTRSKDKVLVSSSPAPPDHTPSTRKRSKRASSEIRTGISQSQLTAKTTSTSTQRITRATSVDITRGDSISNTLAIQSQRAVAIDVTTPIAAQHRHKTNTSTTRMSSINLPTPPSTVLRPQGNQQVLEPNTMDVESDYQSQVSVNGQLFALNEADELRHDTQMDGQLHEGDVIDDGPHETVTNGSVPTRNGNNMSLHTDVPVDAEEIDLARNLACEATIKGYQQLVAKRNESIAELRTMLHIYKIELPGLGFTDSSATAPAVFAAIRNAFQASRTKLSGIENGVEVNTLNNADLLAWLVDRVRGLKEQTHQDIRRLEILEASRTSLQEENHQLLGELENLEDQNAQQQDRFLILDATSDDLRRDLQQLKTTHEALQVISATQSDQIDAQQVRINVLQDSQAADETLILTLRAEKDNQYRDLQELEQLLQRTKVEFEERLEAVQTEKDNVIEDLQDSLRTELGLRTEVEEALADKTAQCDELEKDLRDTEAELGNFRDQLADLREEFADQTTALEDAEADLLQKTTTIEDLETSIAQLEDRVDTLTQDLQAAQDQLATQERQREEIEFSLEEANAKIEDVEAKQAAAEKTANELRMQLFAAQKKREDEVKALQDLATENEQQYQDNLEAEIEQREKAEDQFAESVAFIEKLKAQIRDVEATALDLDEAKNELIDERDAEIAQLQQYLDDLQKKFEDHKETTTADITNLQSELSTVKENLEERSEKVVSLHEELQDLRAEMEQETQNRDDTIADLQDDLRVSKNQIDVLKDENHSLETRVESAAVEMLSFSERTMDEMARLNATVKNRDASISELQTEATKANELYALTVAAKDKDIQHLTVINQDLSSSNEQLTEMTVSLRSALERQMALRADYVNTADAEATEALTLATQIESTQMDDSLYPALPNNDIFTKQELHSHSRKHSASSSVHRNGDTSIISAARSLFSPASATKRTHTDAFADSTTGTTDEVDLIPSQSQSQDADLDPLPVTPAMTKGRGRKAKRAKKGGLRDSGFFEESPGMST